MILKKIFINLNKNKRYLSSYPIKLFIGDDIEEWKSLGFNISKEGIILLNEITIKLCGKENGRGVLGWSFKNITSNIKKIDEIPVINESIPSTISTTISTTDLLHENGVDVIDHIVLQSKNKENTEKEFNSIGIFKKRSREDNEKNIEYSFYRPSQTIIEVLSPINSTSDNQGKIGSKVWGLTFTCQDLMKTHNYLSEITKPPWPAVQKGRMITTLKNDLLDKNGDKKISIRLAFMSPHIKSH